MPDKTATAKSHEISTNAAGDRVIEIAQGEVQTAEGPANEVSLAEVKKPRAGLLQNLGKLRPLLPILSGGLRLIDHGAVQALAQVLSLASGTGVAQSAAQEELQRDMAEIQRDYRELHLQAQDQTVELQRIKDQITLLRQTVESNAAEHAELSENVRSLGNLVRAVSLGLGILLAVLITLTALLLAHHH